MAEATREIEYHNDGWRAPPTTVMYPCADRSRLRGECCSLNDKNGKCEDLTCRLTRSQRTHAAIWISCLKDQPFWFCGTNNIWCRMRPKLPHRATWSVCDSSSTCTLLYYLLYLRDSRSKTMQHEYKLNVHRKRRWLHCITYKFHVVWFALFRELSSAISRNSTRWNF